ncbi:MAG: transposase [Candidatus Nitrosocosmicus sp.]|nr:transposase [Candidatus Nitrosocosmicus sp.]
MVCNSVKYGSTLFTDEYRAYDSLEEHGFVHKMVNHSKRKNMQVVLSMSITMNAEATSIRYGKESSWL